MGYERKKPDGCPPCAKKIRPERKSLIPFNFTLPGFNYLGPGGGEDSGPPTNTIDAIAQEHDIAYDKVIDEFKQTHNVKRSVEEIELADQKFLEDIEQTKATTIKEVLGKAVGFAGIGLKAAVEKVLGFTVYPNFNQIKDNESSSCEGNVIKVQAGDDFN